MTDITPVKSLYVSPDIQACLLCKKSLTKRLHCLAKFKSTKHNYVRIIEQFTGLVLEIALLNEMYVCETCINKCQVSMDFKRTCVDNIQQFENLHRRHKRLSKTPPSSLKVKDTVADQLQRSVEKLKRLDLNGGRSRQKLLFESSIDTHTSAKSSVTSTLDRTLPCTGSTLDQPLSTSCSTLDQPLLTTGFTLDQPLSTTGSTLEQPLSTTDSMLDQALIGELRLHMMHIFMQMN